MLRGINALGRSEVFRRAPLVSARSGYILVSGLPISGNPLADGEPCPDYLVLRRLLRPIVVDPATVRASKQPLIRIVLCLFGIYWAIAVQVLLLDGQNSEIVATGEDVGLRIALLAKLLRRHSRLSIICHNIASRRPAFFLGTLKVGTVVRRFH